MNNDTIIDAEVLHKRMMVQFIRDSAIYSTEDHFVFKSVDGGENWEKICRLRPRSNNSKAKIKDRLLRTGIVRLIRRNIGSNNLIVLRSGTILLQYDGIYRYDGISKFAERVFEFRSKDIKGPLKNGFVVDDLTSNIYFGEYNIDRPYAVRVFRGSNDGTNWELCYQYPEGKIRHIHSIVPDHYRNRIWICTGDNNSECGLFYTDNDFETVNLFKGGDQSWRMVSLIPDNNAIYWGSDAGQDAPADIKNYIYRWDFRKEERERLQCIDKPAYYSCQLQNGTKVIGITHEPKISRRVEPTADLWLSDDGNDWKKVISLEYDPSGRVLGTKYATLCLPLGDNDQNSIFFTPLNVKNYDFSLIKIDLPKQRRV